MAKRVWFTLRPGRLSPPRPAEAKARAFQLIDEFVRKFGPSGGITWENAKAHSMWVVHRDDRSLRIDQQKPAPDPVRPGVVWANLQLQRGTESWACVLMELGKEYPAEAVRTAWRASLEQTQNAAMVWHFVAKPVELLVLNHLHPHQPRDEAAVLAEIYRRAGPGGGVHYHYLAGSSAWAQDQNVHPVRDALRVLETNGLIQPAAGGWVLTDKGIAYDLG